MTTNYDAALAWAGKGYNVVPRKSVDAKRPAVKWKELQSRRVTEAELTKWGPLFANGIGFITGAISGVIVIETDGPAGEAVLEQFGFRHGGLPPTLTIRSGSGRGRHLHFKHPGGKVKTTANENIKVDVRGDGGFCVLPPSLHKSGGRYEIEHDAEPAELPEGLLEFIEAKAAEASGVLSPVADNAAASLAVGELPSNMQRAELTPPPVDLMRAMLRFLAERNYFERRDGVVTDTDGRIVKVGWIEAGMALKMAYGDEVGFELWGDTHIDDRARADAPEQWQSFTS